MSIFRIESESILHSLVNMFINSFGKQLKSIFATIFLFSTKIAEVVISVKASKKFIFLDT